MDTGTTDLDHFRRELEVSVKEAHVQAILQRQDNGWELYHALVLVGRQPPDWSEKTWIYDGLAFVACVVPVRDLAVVSSPAVDVIALGQLRASVPGALGPANWTRRPSYAPNDRAPLPWPVTDYRIAAANQAGRSGVLPHHNLVAAGAPSFPEPNSAWRAFSEGNFSLSGAQGPPTELALIRIAQDEGWIGHVHVTPTQLTAEVDGIAVEGAELELFGVAERGAQSLEGPTTVTFSLQQGLPKSAWLWLKRGTSWLDHRSIDAQSGWTGELARAGVEIDAPIEPQANVEALIAAGEGPQLEYKRQLPENAEQKRKMLKTAAAFATCDGGTMVFGMDPDELTVVGLGDDDPKKLRDRLYDLVHRTVVPPPDVIIGPYTVDGRTILVMEVMPGPTPPYGIAADKGSRDKPEFYVRRGSSTYPAQPADLRQAARSRPPADVASGRSTPFGPW
jgi:hypothetical protein